ncbi:MAG: hypothetical protein RJA26_994 [Actinomycetota bacterium]|jgi:hypothetical protein
MIDRLAQLVRLAAAGVVGLIEPGTLEGNAADAKHLGQFTLAVWALGQTLVGNRLLDVKAVSAVFALVRVGRHNA